MKPWKTLATATAPGGTPLVLQQRDDEYVVRAAGQLLMSSRQHHSEEAMAAAALEGLRAAEPRVLIGGLGMGFALRAVLDRLSPGSRVVMVELSAELVEWNKGPLAPLAHEPLKDPRVHLEVADVRQKLRAEETRYEAVLLDIDNGPTPLVSKSNGSLYSGNGLKLLYERIKRAGRLVVWSAGPDDAFLRRMESSGFAAKAITVAASASGGARHVLFVGYRQ